MTDPHGFKALLREYSTDLGLSLDERKVAALADLGSALLDDPLYPSVSKIREPEDIVLKHMLDSLAPLVVFPKLWHGSDDMLDLGTGGGFPALPLAICFPERKIVAMDARQKSVEFVARMAAALHLSNVHAIQGRAEVLGRDPAYRGRFSLVVSRAVAAVPFARVGGTVLMYKGPKIDEELAEAENALQMLQITPGKTVQETLGPPRFPFERGFLCLTKEKETPEAYPRRDGTPAAKPL